MEKTKFIEKLISMGKDKEEIKTKWTDFEQDAKDYGIMPEATEKYVMQRFLSFYSRNTGGTGIDFRGVILGYQKTDFGVTKVFETAKGMFAEDPAKAVTEGLADEKGQPLYTYGFNKGKPIDLSIAINKICIGVAKCTDKDKATDKFETMTFQLRNDQAKLKIPKFSMVNFKAIHKRGDKGWTLRSSTNTEFEIVQPLENTQIMELVKEYYSEDIVAIKDLASWHADHENDHNRLCIIRSNVSSVMINNGDMSNVVNIMDEVDIEDDFNLEEIKPTTCWLDNETPINFSEGAQNVIVFGKTGISRSSDELSIQAYGIFCPENFRTPENTQEIKPEEQTESIETKPAEPAAKKTDGWVG